MERTRHLWTLIAIACLILGAPTLLSAAISGPPTPGAPCTVSGNPPQLDPPGCDYHTYGPIIHGPGLPSAAELRQGRHKDFVEGRKAPGGLYNGTISQFNSKMEFQLVGINENEGYTRTIILDVDCEAHAGPWNPDDSVISFDTHMVRLEGSIGDNDPDFESLRIIGGLDNGYESPGHQTAVRQEDGTYMLDSMFEIGFRLEYVGAAGGPFEGYAGTSEGTATVKAFAPDGQ